MSTIEPNPGCPTPLRDWLTKAAEAEASDLHLVAGYPPVLRVHGELRQLQPDALAPETVRGLLVELCPRHAMDRFEADRNVDFALELPLGTVGEGKGDRSNLCEVPSGRAPAEGWSRQIGPVPFSRLQRFRVNYFMSGQQMGACFRVIPADIPDFQWAGFPEDLARRLAHYRNGLVLLCGVVGSGKTTSLAMLINLLNNQGGYRIITVEEPVEYLFPKVHGSVVTQREVGLDVHTFADGLKYALRQDPDVILVGEIRDRETAQMALSAGETGHLVFSTLHTRDAKGAVSRYADLFPQSVHREIRAQLALSVRAVVSQHLLPNVRPGEKRVLALEIMFNNSAIGSAIRFGKVESIDNVILTNRAEGMLTLDESIKRLLHDGRISRETAERFVTSASRL